MDRIWQWTWDRYKARYSWAIYAVTVVALLPAYVVLALVIAAFEGSDEYIATAAVAVVATMVLGYVMVLPGLGASRLIELWAAGLEPDRGKALQATYSWTRTVAPRAVAANAIVIALEFSAVGAIAGATASRLVQYAILGAASGVGVVVIAVHSFPEAALRPARAAALAGGAEIGDNLPRSRPTFAAWSNASMLTCAFAFALGGAMLAAAIRRTDELPLLCLVIASALTLGIAVPVTVGAGFSPSMRPIRELAAGSERVAGGDYSRRLPVLQDDDLGALVASFNRMQAGLAERQRLQAAFGTYVDPVLAARLLEQGDEIFTGERREVTVMFVDIRDFTPFAEANTAEDTVWRLNALFEIVVPAVVDAGGHVNKFLGDGALAAFGAPNDLADHAGAAVKAAMRIHRLVAQRFDGELRIGIGINTGTVIAGTIGGASKLESTLIGDAVNVAARVEQLTKTTGDGLLLTEQTVDALVARPTGLRDRGSHELKGKSSAVAVFALDPGATLADGR